jgi:outer membrane protein assembly factor BamB
MSKMAVTKNIFCLFAFFFSQFTISTDIVGQSGAAKDHESRQADLGRGDLGRGVSGADWHCFLGPTGDGKSTETGILTDWSQGKLKRVWKKELGEGYGSGAVAGGRFFQFDRLGENARVRCFNAETGANLWKFEYPSDYRDLYGYDSGPRTSPVIDDNRVYVFGVEGMVICLAADTGELIWQLDTAKKFGVIQNFFGVASTPVIFENLLLVMVGGSPPESQNVAPGALDQVVANGSAIVALNKVTGEVTYKSGDELASYSSIKLARWDGQTVGLAWLRGSLLAFEPATGLVLWRFPFRSSKLESVNATTPVVVDRQVLISECYGIGSVLLNATRSSAEVVWTDRARRKKSLEAHWNTPIVVDGFLYGCSGRHSSEAEMRCVDWETGEVKWTQEGFARSCLTFVDGHFVMLDETGRLVLIKANPDRFEQVAEYEGDVKFKQPCWSAPIVSHGLMYVRGKDSLVCFELIP